MKFGHKSPPSYPTMAFQSFDTNGKLWGVTLRQQGNICRSAIELLDIENEFYQGTEIPFNFESDINLHLEEIKPVGH